MGGVSWEQSEESISGSRKYSDVSNAATRQGGNENFPLHLQSWMFWITVTKGMLVQ